MATAHVEVWAGGPPLRVIAQRAISMALDKAPAQPSDLSTASLALPFDEGAPPLARQATLDAFRQAASDLGVTLVYTEGAGSFTVTRSAGRLAAEAPRAQDEVQRAILEELGHIHRLLAEAAQKSDERADGLSVADWLAVLALVYTILSHIFAALPAH